MGEWEKWSSAGTREFIRCPYPGCLHVAQLITKAHCRMEHDMEREEIGKMHGMPKRVIQKHKIEVDEFE